MSAIANWYEQNGEATGSPAGGVESSISSCDWKSVDSPTVPRTTAPVVAGENSFVKYIYLKFTGTFTQIANVKFAHTGGSLGSGFTLMGKITSDYETPTDADIVGASDITSTTSISSGATVLLGTSGPNDVSPASSQTSSCYTQYIATQVQVSGDANAGDSGSATLSIRYTEN